MSCKVVTYFKKTCYIQIYQTRPFLALTVVTTYNVTSNYCKNYES